MEQMSEVRVVAQGFLQGNCSSANDGVCFFGAIPFASPPLGALRWRAPPPPQPWAGVRPAAALGPMCLQPDLASRETFTGEEDCLFLNVWSPPACAVSTGAGGAGAGGAWPDGGIGPGGGGGSAGECAVMVWVHGGGYTSGWGGNYDGRRDAALASDVIFVTINYRLGALGCADWSRRSAGCTSPARATIPHACGVHAKGP